MSLLKAADALEMAMGIEKNGEAFYRAVAAKVQPGEARNLFELLAQQEVMHYAVFKKLSTAIRGKPLMSAEEWEQYQDYLQTTVHSAFFEGPDKALAAAQEVKDEKQAASAAIAFEKETLLFFYSLRDLVPDRDQNMIDHIIAEEKTHVQRLAKLL